MRALHCQLPRTQPGPVSSPPPSCRHPQGYTNHSIVCEGKMYLQWLTQVGAWVPL